MGSMSAMDVFLMKQKDSSENQYIKKVIGRYLFCEIAYVTSVSNGRVSCKANGVTYSNVEILHLGTAAYGIEIVPVAGDLVLLISTKSTVVDTQKAVTSYSEDIPPYDVAGLKCIPLCKHDNKSTTQQLLKVTSTSLELTGPQKIIIGKYDKSSSSNGIKIQDSNGNTITMSSEGVNINGKLKVGK